ncbi:MAG: hypothetical protein SFX73_10480, partial [Kofleriaceae bacterium]|nr:hypothetical protein [Kofleriaceae bacterium]
LTVTQSTIATNQGGGISSSGGALTVTQSTIATNQGGGISVSNGATFTSPTTSSFETAIKMLARSAAWS